MRATSSARVLTVEDDPRVRNRLRLVLEEAGYELCPDVGDGVEAVELAREQRPDLILIDLNSRRIDPVEATRQILDERDVPILALSSGNDDASLERVLEAGAVAHLRKPIDEERLVDAVGDALAGRVLVERGAGGGRTERRTQQLLIRIDAMLRAGYSEAEIDASVSGG